MDFATLIENNTLFFALVGGVVPALLWLLFWTSQDRKKPEPARVIIGTFILGMLAALFALPAEVGLVSLISMQSLWFAFGIAAIEEFVKFLAMYCIAFRTNACDERIDPMVYAITAALGFAAMENTLYLFEFFQQYDILTAFQSQAKRFMGATVIHTVGAAAIGFGYAVTFCRRKTIQNWAMFAGLLIAIVVHTTFNLLVTSGFETLVLHAFVSAWILLLAAVIIFELIEHSRQVCDVD